MKKSEKSQVTQSQEQVKKSHKSRSKLKGEWYQKNLQEQRRKNRERYHNKYKLNPDYKEKQKKNWVEYVKKKGPDWVLERSRKYGSTPKAKLNSKKYFSKPEVIEKKKQAYKEWAKTNWSKRVEYAKQYRRKIKPQIAIREHIDEARRTGNFGKLADACLNAIIQINEQSRKR